METVAQSPATKTVDLPSVAQSREVLYGYVCPYCGRRTRRCDSSIIYGRSYGTIYLCEPCRAWVGVHKGGMKQGDALGRLANSELRKWKQAAHAHFDALWMMSKRKRKREKAYAWLAQQLGLPEARTHIGMFNVEQCKETVRLCKELVDSLRRTA